MLNILIFDNKISYCFGLAIKEKTTFEFRMKGKEGLTVNVNCGRT